MRIRINLSQGTHSLTCSAVRRALWEPLYHLYPCGHFSVDVQAGGPIGSVYTLCHVGDPEEIPYETWQGLEATWRAKVASIRCPGCRQKIWKRRDDTPRELALMATSRGEPIEVLITEERQHNWRVMASQHTSDCVCIRAHGLTPFVVGNDAMPMVVQTISEEDRIRPVSFQECYKLAVATAMGSPDAIKQSQRLLANEKWFAKTDHLILRASSQQFPHSVTWAEIHSALLDWESHGDSSCPIPILPGGRIDDREARASRASRAKPRDLEAEERFAEELEEWFREQGILADKDSNATKSSAQELNE